MPELLLAAGRMVKSSSLSPILIVATPVRHTCFGRTLVTMTLCPNQLGGSFRSLAFFSQGLTSRVKIQWRD